MESVKKEPEAGWNDPPKFSFNESMEYSKSPKRNQLNKRVAFPMNSSQLVTSSQQNAIDPTTTPVFNTNLPPPPVSSVTSSCCQINSSSEKDQSKEPSNSSTDENISCTNASPESDGVPSISNVLENLVVIMDEKREALNTLNKLELIKKKLQIMEDSWKTNKLPDEVKQRLFELSDALKNKDKTKADLIQISLMVDHPKLCSDFMSAFRQLISID